MGILNRLSSRILIGSLAGVTIAAIPIQKVKAEQKLLIPSVQNEKSDVASSYPLSVKMEQLVKDIQREMVSGLEQFEGPDGKKFELDSWKRKEGGYGVSAVLQDGKVFEKAGVNFSVISSPAPKPMLQHMRSRKPMNLDDNKKYNMFVAGVSMVMHPVNPHAPTFHANYRYFELREDGSEESVASWFGGGTDLTPSYLYPEDAMHFHKVIKEACDKHDESYYPKFKKWCDEYFFLTHRGEARGVGGIFFDDLDTDPKKTYHFVYDCAHALVHQYLPIIAKRKDMPYTKAEKEWQQLRRGRYVEFNLVIDRGTKFGLVTPGVRIESVLMSLPLTARWQYMHSPILGSKEDELLQVLRKPREWVK
ncbi:Coproporphyrinogen-III oxidase [Boothiomyces macroporosus]|uniref:coproporphyrinogen oxidase n=1 Tax=Boothiomyces macroporosus TaxID=261099 RepID=A0AAD5Y0Z1_9FUNG|nr:Coproporphyrinogen-III oxidase [Boothiomyces macroporosus]KAJ3310475.1 Coproporphyrinogen-III oxidase [Boothiomyces sp. JEL0838]